MLKMVDGTGIIGVDMICPLGVSTPQPPNYDRVELEGAGMLVLPISLDSALEGLELGGKTEQVQTTGKNLANPSEFVVGNLAGDTGNIIALKQYITTGYIPVIPGKMYSTSCGNKFLAHTIIAYDKEKTKINSPINMSSEMPEGAAYIRQAYRKIDMTNVTESDMEELKKVCMVNEGSTVLSYEPYTGGKPSPSPEYPQEILNAGRLNEDTGKYEIDVTINSGNLFKLIEHTSGYYVDKDGKVQIAKTVGYSWTAAVNNLQKQSVTLHVTTMINARYRLYCTDLQNTILYKHEDSSANTNDNSHTFNMPDGTKKIYVSVIEINSVEQAEITLNLGNVTLPYEPYKEQTLTLTSDRPLTKWDRLVEQSGQIGWLYGSVIATIDETAIISLYEPKGFYVYVKNIDKKEKTGYCDKLYAKRMSNGEPFVLFGNANNNVLYTLNTQEFYGKTVSEIKEKLKEYPLNIIGKSETTEFVPLPQSEQNAIRALKTYYPTTVITADGGEPDPDIKVPYRKEKEYELRKNHGKRNCKNQLHQERGLQATQRGKTGGIQQSCLCWIHRDRRKRNQRI